MRVETFRGSREHYRDWLKIVQAQQALYRLDDYEMAMIIYLNCQGEARRVLNVLSLQEMQEPGGLHRILRLLEESFGREVRASPGGLFVL